MEEVIGIDPVFVPKDKARQDNGSECAICQADVLLLRMFFCKCELKKCKRQNNTRKSLVAEGRQ